MVGVVSGVGLLGVQAPVVVVALGEIEDLPPLAPSGAGQEVRDHATSATPDVRDGRTVSSVDPLRLYMCVACYTTVVSAPHVLRFPDPLGTFFPPAVHTRTLDVSGRPTSTETALPSTLHVLLSDGGQGNSGPLLNFRRFIGGHNVRSPLTNET